MSRIRRHLSRARQACAEVVIVVDDPYNPNHLHVVLRSTPVSSIMSTTIPVELLHALLSPDPAVRCQAEVCWRSSFATVLERAVALTVSLGSTTSTCLPPHLQQMTAVLLRRDILLVCDPEELVPLTARLVRIFVQEQQPTPTTKAVGDCLAEACAVLERVAPAQASSTMHDILQVIGPEVCVRDCLIVSCVSVYPLG
jgi:hypothetical protein